MKGLMKEQKMENCQEKMRWRDKHPYFVQLAIGLITVIVLSLIKMPHSNEPLTAEQKAILADTYYNFMCRLSTAIILISCISGFFSVFLFAQSINTQDARHKRMAKVTMILSVIGLLIGATFYCISRFRLLG